MILPEFGGTNPPEFRDTHVPISSSIGMGKGDTRPPLRDFGTHILKYVLQ